ncbi:HDOD domain-containing protein [Pseudomonas sp. C27(2019)]|uniref:HDOD domain-containing protein n=1 Tax=Pseudomonas sp. C27(2019) TaxID=2604941 RepID=UPI00124644C0|nr:HDOD domain-containing protein [Pseudomonas sp. C27(2019)]QEY59539.1 HDOD domain-containing protein [Pseudomonas sp. C27(2019)]
MTNTTPQNNTLEQWIIQLDNTRLPVYKAHRERALQALQSPNKSLGDIAQVISQAPTIALIIMREANRASSSLAEPVQTLDNALSRLGLQRCAALLKDLQDDQETEIPIALRQVWLIGQHLNVQAMGLFGKRMARLWQEIHWGSLLFLSPAWPLLTRHPEFFSEWERRVLGDNESANAVEHELIGMPLITLCLGLAEHWKLPNWVIDGYRLLKDNPEQLAQALYIARQTEQPLLQQQMLDQMPALNSWLNRPANTIVFTCGLVMAAHNSWGSEQCVRWQRLISLYLNKELASVQQNTHRLAVKHAQMQRHPDLWQPAQALLWPWDTQRLRKPPTQSNPLPPSKEDLARWRSHCTELLRDPSAFNTLVQMTQHIGLALQACGMQRICVMMLDQNAEHAKVSYLYGIQAQQLPHIFPLKQTPVNQHLLEKPTFLRLDDSNAARFNPQLPPELVAVFGKTHWLMASVSNSQRVVMLLAADQATASLHPTTVQGFKKTLECIERALVLFSSRKR